jgi:hypothetical protein
VDPSAGSGRSRVASDRQMPRPDRWGRLDLDTHMSTEHPATSKPVSPAGRERLAATRDALIRLHKALIEAERVPYERSRGRIDSPQEFLRLVMYDEWFAWLRPMSELIVRIDEALAADAPPSDRDASHLIEHTRTLLTNGETPFGQRHHEVLQREPAVLIAHGEVIRRLATVH